MRRWTRPLPAEPDRAILSNVWTTSTCYKPLEIERPDFAENDACSTGPSLAHSCIIPGCPDANFSKKKPLWQRFTLEHLEAALSRGATAAPIERPLSHSLRAVYAPFM